MTEIDLIYKAFQASTGVCTDTRKLLPQEIFFALKGPRFNGNEHAQAALEKGAVAVVVDEEQYKTSDNCFLVEDALESLKELANHHRKQFKIPVIALTGSNGKTTTKELIAAVLSKKYKTLRTQGNLNNHIGVPLTLLNLNSSFEMAVVEMGANHPIEINQLCKIAEPNFGLITNIGKAHLEGFGSLKGVQQAKGELFEFLEAIGGKTFANVNDPLIVELAYYIQNVHTYGSQKFTKTQVEMLAADPFLKVRWVNANPDSEVSMLDIETQLIGAYNLDNVIAAIAIGQKFKVSPQEIKEALAAYRPANNRSQLVEQKGNRYILDAYNANPSSMMAALKNFSQMDATKKVLILGDMKEQGDNEKVAHEEVIAFCAEKKFDEVFFVGEIFLQQENASGKFFKDVDALKSHLANSPIENASVLVKGSRSIGLEKILD